MKFYKKIEEMYEDVKDKQYCLAYDNSYNDVGEIK